MSQLIRLLLRDVLQPGTQVVTRVTEGEPSLLVNYTSSEADPQ